MSADHRTIGVYQGRATEYAARFDKPEDSRLDGFLAAMPAGSTFLDYGCGPGRAACHAAAAGMDAHAFDAAPAMVALASACPGVTAWNATFDAFDADAAYGGIWASFSLLHAPRAAMPGHLSAIHRALVPEGRLMLGLKLGSGEARDTIGRLYTYYSEAEITDLLVQAGFAVESVETGRDDGFDGTPSDWIILMAQRPA